jgi:hypothetical protein
LDAVLARIVLAVALASACAGAASAPALGATASAYQAVLRVYERQGTVPPCQFSPAQLESALNGVDAYGAQYFADFTQAIQNALSVRASGSCAGGAGVSRAGATPRRPPGSVGPPAHFGPLTAATSAGVPAPLALMGALAAAAALGAGAVAAVGVRDRRRGRSPGDVDSSQAARI